MGTYTKLCAYLLVRVLQVYKLNALLRMICKDKLGNLDNRHKHDDFKLIYNFLKKFEQGNRFVTLFGDIAKIHRATRAHKSAFSTAK